MELNIEKRTEVLEYALEIEDAIKNLLLMCLGIRDDERTKLFGKKAGISFQSKIDLLYDIDVIGKEEHQGLELQMNFRNRFLHDIKSNTYLSVLSYFDNGIKNRFNKYIPDGGEISDEESCREAYQNLYSSNLKVIIAKIELKKNAADDTMDLLSTPTKLYTSFADRFFNIIQDIYNHIEGSNIESPDVIELINKISQTCKEHTSKFIDKDGEYGLYADYYSRLSNANKLKDIFK